MTEILHPYRSTTKNIAATNNSTITDKRIMRLVEEGVTPCVVGAWGYHLPWLDEERMKQLEAELAELKAKQAPPKKT